jgi:pyruvate carboxylase
VGEGFFQRRHQKMIEMAPLWHLSDESRREPHTMVKLTSEGKNMNVGMVEFLVYVEN